ncbi:hypothetical protein GQ53DRAFT_744304 [Thozetella sp. PMI_491]|nr:hypothetical protein GQ53DRAFT_744304 [Thozetella sp. PMI_491]
MATAWSNIHGRSWLNINISVTCILRLTQATPSSGEDSVKDTTCVMAVMPSIFETRRDRWNVAQGTSLRIYPS